MTCTRPGHRTFEIPSEILAGTNFADSVPNRSSAATAVVRLIKLVFTEQRQLHFVVVLIRTKPNQLRAAAIGIRMSDFNQRRMDKRSVQPVRRGLRSPQQPLVLAARLLRARPCLMIPAFFRGDLWQRVTKHRNMIESDRSYHRHNWDDHVRRVEPTAEAYLDHHHIGADISEVQECHCGLELENTDDARVPRARRFSRPPARCARTEKQTLAQRWECHRP